MIDTTRIPVTVINIASIMSTLAKTANVPVGADVESRRWLLRLRSEGPERANAVAELHDLLLRAARFEVHRRRAAMPFLRGDDYDDLAQQGASDALVAILDKLDDYRGESRFTTWAYKFALLEAAVKLRRRAWQGRELPHDDETWSEIVDGQPTPDRDAETSQLMRAVHQGIDRELTPHQRQILIALTVRGVPIDVLAERMKTTRGALYKALHDARRKLRAYLAAREVSGGGVEGAIA